MGVSVACRPGPAWPVAPMFRAYARFGVVVGLNLFARFVSDSTGGSHTPSGKRSSAYGAQSDGAAAYGDLLVRTNRWDPGVLARFRADPLVAGFRGAIDANATNLYPKMGLRENVATSSEMTPMAGRIMM